MQGEWLACLLKRGLPVGPAGRVSVLHSYSPPFVAAWTL